MQTPSDYLYARPSFAEGAARILDFGNTLNEYNTAGELDPDYVALWMDWAAIGGDFRYAVGEFVAEDAEEYGTPPARRKR